VDYARRTPEQLRAAARAFDTARAAGLPDDLLIIALDARRAWWDLGTWPDPLALQRLIDHPAAPLVDETLCAAIRAHLTARSA
jgi:hypothetical protein